MFLLFSSVIIFIMITIILRSFFSSHFCDFSGRQKALRVLATSARIDSVEAINLGLIDGIIDEFPLKNEVNLSRTKF